MAAASTTQKVKQKYKCVRCGKTMVEDKFYTHSDGNKDEMCKECLCAHVDNFDPSTFLWILERMDVPYIPAEWNTLRDKTFQQDPKKIGGPAVMGKYLSKMKLKQWINPETGKPYRWEDADYLIKTRYAEEAISEEQLKAAQERDEALKQQFESGEISEAEYKTLSSTESQKEDVFSLLVGATEIQEPAPAPFGSEFISEDELPDLGAELTLEDKKYLAMKWGRLYKPSEWIELEKKYTEMMDSFDIQDADTRNTLILMCKTDLKMNQAIDLGDVDGYQKLARVSDGLRKSGKFTAAQNKEKDNDQISCIGQLVAFCEQEEGFIPRFEIDTPRDVIDEIIQDNQKYLYNLITKDLGFGQQIENYLKKIELEHEALEKPINEEEEELEDEDIKEFYERINEDIEEDIQTTSESIEEEDDEDGAS